MIPSVSPWSFGWEAIAALASATASVGALWVALLTRSMAVSAQLSADSARVAAQAASEEAAAAFRPVALPTAVSIIRDLDDNHELRIKVSNVGAGPALEAMVHLGSSHDWENDRQLLIMVTTPIRVGEDFTMRHEVIPDDHVYFLQIDFNDITGKRRFRSQAHLVFGTTRDPWEEHPEGHSQFGQIQHAHMAAWHGTTPPT